MPVCSVCAKERFLIYKRYQNHRLHPPRCIGCIVRFPTNGTDLAVNSVEKLKVWSRTKHKYHGWVLVQQTKKFDVWFCPYCRKVLTSPKLGVPTSAGCLRGSKYKFKMGFWASMKLDKILCPLCDKEAELLVVPRIVRRRPGKGFPMTCRECFGAA